MLALIVIVLVSDHAECVDRFPKRAPASARAYFNLFDDTFIRVGAERNLDPALLKAIAWCETRLDPCAISPAGAKGLMQIVSSVCLCQGESALGSSARIVRPSRAVASLNESQKQEVVQAKTAANEVTSWLR